MQSIKHSVAEELRDVPLEELIKKRVARFDEIEPDWDAFADSQVEGRRRAQHRFIGAGGSGKHDPKVIPAGGFTLSIMRVPPGQGGSAHTHEVEEAFFVLDGVLTVFFEDAAGRRSRPNSRNGRSFRVPPASCMASRTKGLKTS